MDQINKINKKRTFTPTIVGWGKFFVKVYIVAGIRSILVFLLQPPVNRRENSQKKILLINLEGLGDVILMTASLKWYRDIFPKEHIAILVTKTAGLPKEFFGGIVDEVICVDYKKIARNPWYGYKVIKNLRSIGFETVINNDPSVAEIVGKTISISIGARSVFIYEGLGIQYQKPLDQNMKNNVAYVRRFIFPQCTKVIPSIDRYEDTSSRLLHFIDHYRAIYEGVAEIKNSELTLAPFLVVPKSIEEVTKKMMDANELKSHGYCVIVLGTTTVHREWGAERFARAASVLVNAKIPVVLCGSRGREEVLAEKFKQEFKGVVVDLIGKTTIPEMIGIISQSLFCFTNDTGPAHIAVALNRPLVCVLGLGHFGMLSLYGYPLINRWVYAQNMNCLCDNWQCIWSVGPNDPVPCIQSITEEQVKKTISEVIRAASDQGAIDQKLFTLHLKA